MESNYSQTLSFVEESHVELTCYGLTVSRTMKGRVQGPLFSVDFLQQLGKSIVLKLHPRKIGIVDLRRILGFLLLHAISCESSDASLSYHPGMGVTTTKFCLRYHGPDRADLNP